LRLKALLTSELTPISEMSHESAPKERSIDDEGKTKHMTYTTVACNVGDSVEVMCDYSPGSVPRAEQVLLSPSLKVG
jgi:hypothetical protein